MKPDFSNIHLCEDCGGVLPYCDREADICQECCDSDRVRDYFLEMMKRRVDITGLTGHEIFDQHKSELEFVDDVDEFIDEYIVKYDLTDLTKVKT